MSKIEFKGALGDMLAAKLETTGDEPTAYALFAHCFTCGKDILAATTIAKTLATKNIDTLRFDFSGLGRSEGDFANTNFSSNVEDLIKAADYMRKNLKAPSIIIGHSLGGAAVLKAARHIPEVKAVVTIAAPADAAHVAHHFDHKIEEIKEEGEAMVELAGRPFKIKKQFIDDLEKQKMDNRIGDLKRALLVMHSPTDDTVGIENAEHIYKQAKHPKSFVSLDGADHLLRGKEHSQYAGEVIAAWAGKYI